MAKITMDDTKLKLQEQVSLWTENADSNCRRCNGRGWTKIRCSNGSQFKKDDQTGPEDYTAQQCVCSARKIRRAKTAKAERILQGKEL